MDNLPAHNLPAHKVPAHKVPALRAAIERTGARAFFTAAGDEPE
jgi:hypothetical protein